MSLSIKKRFIAALPPIPPGLNLRLDEFVEFSRASMTGLGDEEIRFLAEYGLPRQASPFLSFSSYSKTDMDDLRNCGAIPDTFFPLGQNGSGDLLGIDVLTNEVVYFNHDANNERIFVNSTLQQFAESLCLYQEHLRADTMIECLDEIEKIDPSAARLGSMWHTETQSC